jgi:hypothetical protein
MGRKAKELNDVRFCAQCGKQIEARTYYRKDGSVKGYYMPDKYCSLSCTGKAAHQTQFKKKRGYFIDKHGYVLLTEKTHGGYQQPAHRAVMEAHIGRKLFAHETVHHKDGNRQNNAIKNLELWSTRHGKGQRVSDKIAFCIDFLKEYGIGVEMPPGGIGVPIDHNPDEK